MFVHLFGSLLPALLLVQVSLPQRNGRSHLTMTQEIKVIHTKIATHSKREGGEKWTEILTDSPSSNSLRNAQMPGLATMAAVV